MRFIPNFKGYDFFPHGTHINFMRYRNICFWASIIAIVVSIGLFVDPRASTTASTSKAAP